MLGNITDEPLKGAAVIGTDILSVDAYAALRGIKAAEQKLHQGGLAAAGSTDDGECLSLLYMEAYILQYRSAPS